MFLLKKVTKLISFVVWTDWVVISVANPVFAVGHPFSGTSAVLLWSGGCRYRHLSAVTAGL